MPRKLVKVTPARLATWNDCRRRYRMTYLDRPAPQRGGPWAHSTLGAAVHNALRAFFDLPVGKRNPASAANLVVSNWRSEGFADAEQSAKFRQRAKDWVADYVAEIDVQTDPIGIERWVSSPAGADRRRGPGRPDRPARGRTGHRRLQDRPARVDHRRRAWLAGVGPVRDRRPADVAPSVSSSGIAPPANRIRGFLDAHRRIAASAPEPRRGDRGGAGRGARNTGRGWRADVLFPPPPGGSAPGATSGAAAPRASRPHPNWSHGRHCHHDRRSPRPTPGGKPTERIPATPFAQRPPCTDPGARGQAQTRAPVLRSRRRAHRGNAGDERRGVRGDPGRRHPQRPKASRNPVPRNRN